MQVCAIFIKATYFYLCILWVRGHKSEHNRFIYFYTTSNQWQICR